MKSKPKFKPKITRVKLNPEQAVLACNCYRDGFMIVAYGETPGDACWEKGIIWGDSTLGAVSS